MRTLLAYDALGFILPAANSPGIDIVNNRPLLAFDDSATEIAYTRPMPMPQAYGGGELVVYIGYTMASATTGKVDFEVAVEAINTGDAAPNFDSINEVSGGTTVPSTIGHLGVAAVTLTNKDGVAAGDMVRFSLSRDHDDVDDTATGDARVLWVEIRES